MALNRGAVLMLSAHFEGHLEELMQEAVTAVHPQLDTEPLVRPFANPWPDRIDDLFAFLGLQQPARSISWRKASTKTVRDNLETLVRTRNRVAHGATEVTVYKTDVTRLRKYVEGFARRFDELVRDQVETLTGQPPWPQ